MVLVGSICSGIFKNWDLQVFQEEEEDDDIDWDDSHNRIATY